MKTILRSSRSPQVGGSRLAGGFTLPEALISATLLVLLLGGIVTANLFGMRMFQLAETKLKADDGARKVLGLLADDIRRCNTTSVGNVTNGTFVGLLDGEVQTGSALLVQSSTNSASFILYFLNPADQSLRRMVSATSTTTVLAQTVTNTAIFSAQDCFGNILTNNQNNRVIHACFDFVQPQPWLPAPDYSKLETSVTRRITD